MAGRNPRLWHRKQLFIFYLFFFFWGGEVKDWRGTLLFVRVYGVMAKSSTTPTPDYTQIIKLYNIHSRPLTHKNAFVLTFVTLHYYISFAGKIKLSRKYTYSSEKSKVLICWNNLNVRLYHLGKGGRKSSHVTPEAVLEGEGGGGGGKA